MNYILVLRLFGSQSTRMIAERMSEPCAVLGKSELGWTINSEVEGKRSWAETSGNVVWNILNDSGNKIINWGNRIFNDDSLFDLNIPHAIALASNKKIARRILQNAGVAVPKTYFDPNLASWTHEAKYPIIVRPSQHHKGNHFNVFEDGLTLEAFLWGRDDWYASELFEKTNEYRVYVAHGKVLFVHEKPLVDGEIRANYAINHEAWPVLKWSQHNEKVNLESIKAVEILGLDYGAVDIMYNAQTNDVAIAEVNTSPQITTEYTSKKFAEYFSWAIRHNFPAHFEPQGTSVFYNTILRD